jgi:hypothetical protein
MLTEDVAIKPASEDRPQKATEADKKAAAMIAQSRYQTPTVVSFPLSGMDELGQLSMVGNPGGGGTAS